MKNIHEKTVKALLIQHLLENNNKGIIINEFSVNFFERRLDIALITNYIDFFEIKTEADTLKRLKGQSETFSKFCDKFHIICAPCHIEKVLSETPNNVGVWELRENKTIKKIRRGKRNILTDKNRLIQMLHSNELKQILSSNGIEKTVPRRKYLQAEAYKIDTKILRKFLIEKLKERHAKANKQLINVLKSETLTYEHIDELSIYKRESKKNNHGYEYCDDTYLCYLAYKTDKNIFGKIPQL